ncbi:hypothetical protein J3R82DRAFT_11944 [Butyriboletus roseoflavus]|nr:hypothetical protein J3R82DRAFT_11944 [Butyriboletus roseoflavus]
MDSIMTLICTTGMKRLEIGAFVKGYEGPDKEIELVIQMVISQLASEDSCFLEKAHHRCPRNFPTVARFSSLGNTYMVSQPKWQAPPTRLYLSFLLYARMHHRSVLLTEQVANSFSLGIKRRTTISNRL